MPDFFSSHLSFALGGHTWLVLRDHSWQGAVLCSSGTQTHMGCLQGKSLPPALSVHPHSRFQGDFLLFCSWTQWFPLRTPAGSFGIIDSKLEFWGIMSGGPRSTHLTFLGQTISTDWE